MKKKKGLAGRQNTFSYVALTIMSIFFILPLLWLILASVDTNASQAVKLPAGLTLNHYKEVAFNAENIRAFLVGIYISGGQTIIVVICAALAAYPLSRFKIKNKNTLLLSLLFMTSLPITAVMVPVYQLFLFINLQDSIIGTILFLSASMIPFAIWIMKNFMDTVPKELEEAAWIDGASMLNSLRLVILPLMLPGVLTVSIFVFIGSWGNFFVPYILLQTPEKLPASVTIFQFFGQYGMIQYGKLAAFSILYTIPPFVLYFYAQRHLSEGFNLGGAAKG